MPSLSLSVVADEFVLAPEDGKEELANLDLQIDIAERLLQSAAASKEHASANDEAKDGEDAGIRTSFSEAAVEVCRVVCV